MTPELEQIRLTQYSHGAGCGCKIAPAVLDKILHSSLPQPNYENLLVGNGRVPPAKPGRPVRYQHHRFFYADRR
jgi:selenophosphate synthase